MFNKVPIPGFWFKNNQKINTVKLTKKVIKPIDIFVFKEIPCAKTLQGDAPENDTIRSPSPIPNKVRPNIK